MHTDVVEIRYVIRAMRGRSRSYLVQGRNGVHYVAKLLGNPQGTRTLVNEWIVSKLFKTLGVSTPNVALLQFSEESMAQLEGAFERLNIAHGPHLGSQLPIDPNVSAIYDFLPGKLLGRVHNRAQFLKVLMLDCLLAQTDSRQAVFVRRNGGVDFSASFIDHGGAFSASAWNFQTPAASSFYFDLRVYCLDGVEDVIREMKAGLTQLRQTDLASYTKTIPSEWLMPGERQMVLRLLHEFLDRALRFEELVYGSLEKINAGCAQ